MLSRDFAKAFGQIVRSHRKAPAITIKPKKIFPEGVRWPLITGPLITVPLVN